MTTMNDGTYLFYALTSLPEKSRRKSISIRPKSEHQPKSRDGIGSNRKYIQTTCRHLFYYVNRLINLKIIVLCFIEVYEQRKDKDNFFTIFGVNRAEAHSKWLSVQTVG